VEAALRRARAQLAELRRPKTYPNRLLVKDGGRTIIVQTSDIAWAASADNYVELHMAAKKTCLLRETMTRLAGQLDPAKFMRIHRSTLVNVEHIREITPLFNKDHIAVLRDGEQLTVSRTYYERLLAALKRQ